MWIEIFKEGTQTDSAGVAHNGDELIRKAVSTFNASEYEPPVVVGHPKTDDPAYGWVEALKEKSGGLWAKLRDMAPEFVEALKNKHFKKRSASFYPDGRLRHVGFLGATPPAVKGLADLRFEADEVFVCFEEEVVGAPGGHGGPSGPGGPGGQERGEEEEDMGKIEELEAEVKRLKAESAAKEAEKAAAVEAAKAEFAEASAREKRTGWIKSKVEGGVIPPALAEGLVEFVGGLDAGATFEFGEKAVNQADFFMGFLEKTFAAEPFAGMFKTAASKEFAGVAGNEDFELGKRIAEKVG